MCELTVILRGFFYSFLDGSNNLSLLHCSLAECSHCYAVLSNAKLTERVSPIKLNLICLLHLFINESKWRTWMLREKRVVTVAWFSYTFQWDLFPQLLGNNPFKMKLCSAWKQVMPMVVCTDTIPLVTSVRAKFQLRCHHRPCVGKVMRFSHRAPSGCWICACYFMLKECVLFPEILVQDPAEARCSTSVEKWRCTYCAHGIHGSHVQMREELLMFRRCFPPAEPPRRVLLGSSAPWSSRTTEERSAASPQSRLLCPLRPGAEFTWWFPTQSRWECLLSES